MFIAVCVFSISKFQVSVLQILSPTTKHTLNTIRKCLAIVAYFAFGMFRNVSERFGMFLRNQVAACSCAWLNNENFAAMFESSFCFRRSNLFSKNNTHNYVPYLTILYQILGLNTGDSKETIFVFTSPKIVCTQGVKFFSIWLLARHLHRTENT